jgi:hypothetical protein
VANSLFRVPAATTGELVWNLYVAHHLPFCGVAMTNDPRTRGVFFVRETGCARVHLSSEARFSSTVVAIIGHELGHTLRLAHTGPDCGLMTIGISGVVLNAWQGALLRRQAATQHGCVGCRGDHTPPVADQYGGRGRYRYMMPQVGWEEEGGGDDA